ncbi:acyltransferase [Aliiglaciecola sp. 2_MG-2023]|uniref:acyltransferase n=1 Tax=unclassified Aliiglaciecola TaxID=2593648 RepID=UPI0026E31727|nr:MULTISPECIES: acyltransferase [unclassified Aliiglaciecola]MDO6709128.1 acyltransferase [Aliiglaciecola sp. 2_MG-2023]MDO6750276.1 acyltransferase [Aliiglaciecola sp. 1_MG-2023]
MEFELNTLQAQIFENDHSNSALFGKLILEGDASLENLSGLKIRVPDNKPEVNNIVIKIKGKIESRLVLHIHEDNCDVTIGQKVRGAYLVKLWGNTSLNLNERTTSNFTEIWVQENGSVEVGADCMFAHDVVIMCGDMHGIFEISTKKQINLKSPEICIGNHVWLGRRSVICKNTSIGDGSIVGVSSVVTKSFPKSVAIAGNPAKLIKNDTSWCRSALCTESEMDSVIRLIS